MLEVTTRLLKVKILNYKKNTSEAVGLFFCPFSMNIRANNVNSVTMLAQCVAECFYYCY